MTSNVISLAGGFAPTTSQDWLVLVEKTLKGAAAETLVRRTPDGLAIRPLYTAADSAAPLPFTPSPRGGSTGWDVRASVEQADPAEANANALAALSGGASSLLVRVAQDGQAGVAITAAEGLARVLDGVKTELAPVSLDAGFLGPVAASWLDAAAKASPAALLAFHLDPLSTFARAGGSPGPIEAHIAEAAATAARLSDSYPRAGLFLASGAVVHEAGGGAAWEIAQAIASAVAYAKAQVAAGLTMEAAFAGITVGLAVDAEPLVGIAKLRAARVLWTRVTGACGVSVTARIEARSSVRMLTRADRWTNLIRLTSADFAAAVGGADAIVLGAFTDALAAPDAFALRISRNTQLVLMEEAQLGRVADPAAGAWAVETLTHELAEAAWAAFVAIEAAGGAAAALSAGVVAEAVAASREALKAALADRSLRVIGVTDFKSEEAAAEAAFPPVAAAPPPRHPGADGACPPLNAIRIEELAQ